MLFLLDMPENTLINKPLKRFFRMLSLDRKDIYLVIIYAIFAGLIGLALPLGIQAIINLIAIGQTTSSWIVLSFIVAAATAVVGVMKLMQIIITETIQQRIFARSAFEFAYRIPRFKIESIKEEYAPEMANRFFDTLNVQKGIPKIIVDLPASMLQILFGLILLALYHPFFVFFGLFLLILLTAIILSTYPTGIKTSLMESKYKYKVAYWLEELGRTMSSFKLAGRTRYPIEKTDELVEGYLKHRQKHFNIIKIQLLSHLLLRTLATLALLLIGGLLVIDNQMNIGQFVASEIVIIIILNSLEKVILSMDTIFDVLTAIEKIGAVTDVELESEEGIDFQELTMGGGLDIKICNLSYQPNSITAPVLENINLDIKSGERVCITGFNSSGKSTLLRIIIGLYSNYTGSISYNGIPASNINIDSLRSYIGDYITDEHLFQGTLKQNICLGRDDLNIQDIMQVCSMVGLTKYIEFLPKGLDTILPSDGQGLSQTTIKKIILARCIVDKPMLIALEPLLSGMETDDQHSMLRLVTDRKLPWTLIAISRNPHLASQCDKVVVMKAGRIIFNGPYHDLTKEPYYYNIFDDSTPNDTGFRPDVNRDDLLI